MKISSAHNKAIIHKKILLFIVAVSFCSLLSIYFSVSHTLQVNAEILDRDQMEESIKKEVDDELKEEFSEPSENSNDVKDNDNNGNSEDTVSNTGNNTSVEKKDENSTETDVQNNNNADVTQQVNAEANTGHNEASRNISIGGNAGIIKTGDASVNTVGVVNANNSKTGISGGSSGSGGSGDIVNTGNDSTYSSDSKSRTTTAVGNDNRATIYQGANTKANTGNNVADGNISIGGTAGQIITGAASTKTSFLATANQSVVLVGGKSNGNGPGAGASIITTGNRHSSSIAANNHQSTKVTNTNAAYVSQSCGVNASCIADTGNNNSSRNINRNGDAGIIKTGDARVDVKLLASVNSSFTAVDNSQSQYYDPFGITNTGDDNSFSSESTDRNGTSVENNNTAVVSQSVNAYANTGHNKANRNISFGGDAGVIETGDAEIEACLIADVNESKTVIAQSTPKPRPTSTPSPTETPNPTPSPSPSVSPTPSPSPTPTPDPNDNGDNGGNHDNGSSDNDDNNDDNNDDDEGEEPQNETVDNPVNSTFEKFIGGIGPGQVLAASDIAPATFADTGLSRINWYGLLKTLIVLMIGYTLSSAPFCAHGF